MTTETTSDTKITSENPNEVGITSENPNEVCGLKDAELEKVTGGTASGKPTVSQLSWSHYYDKSSP